MVQVVSYDDVSVDRVQKTGRSGKPYWRTSFITPQRDEDPQVYLIENSPEMTIGAHFHEVDQFQIFVRGEGKLGRHDVDPVSVHFARAYTTYGPIESRGDGLSWMTLRPHRDLGAKMIDKYRDELVQKHKDRAPWQTTKRAAFQPAASAGDLVDIIAGERGLAARALTLAPGGTLTAPNPADSPCQYILVTRGSLVHAGQEKRSPAVVHVTPADGPYTIVAGPQGLECLVLNFPREVAIDAAQAQAPAVTAWTCQLCGFTYEVAKGLPEEGIAPGTPWEEISDDFVCPDCSSTKDDFVPAAD